MNQKHGPGKQLEKMNSDYGELFSPTQLYFTFLPHWKDLNQMESNIYSKCKPFLAPGQHPLSFQIPYMVVHTIRRQGENFDPPWRTESSEGPWAKVNELSEVDRSWKMSFGAWTINTERSLTVLLICHLKKKNWPQITHLISSRTKAWTQVSDSLWSKITPTIQREVCSRVQQDMKRGAGSI